MTDLDLAREIERLHLAFEEAKKGPIEDRALPVAKLQATLMVNRDKIIAALRRGPEDDKEIGEFQQRVYELCEKFYPHVDGAGSDTGDWRDFTLAEIRQTLNHLAENPPSGEDKNGK